MNIYIYLPKAITPEPSLPGPRLQLDLQGLRLVRGRRYVLQVTVAHAATEDDESWRPGRGGRGP